MSQTKNNGRTVFSSSFFDGVFLDSYAMLYMEREKDKVCVLRSSAGSRSMVYIALALLMIDEPSFESSFIACLELLRFVHTKRAEMWSNGEIPSFVGKNVLLLVGINHTGGWHYYGGDLLTCALLAHAHPIHIHTTRSSSSTIKYSRTYVKYLRVLHIHSITCKLGQQPKTQFRMFFLMPGLFVSFRFSALISDKSY